MAQKFLQQESKKTCPCFRELKGTNLLLNQGSSKQNSCKRKLKSEHVKVPAKTFVLYMVLFVKYFNTK